jgi:excisionase family DNA binding protein
MISDIKETVLSSKEAADYLRVSHGTLIQWRTTKRVTIPFMRIGRNCKYLLYDLNDFLERCRKSDLSKV